MVLLSLFRRSTYVWQFLFNSNLKLYNKFKKLPQVNMPSDVSKEAVVENYEKALQLVKFLRSQIYTIETEMNCKALKQENEKLVAENEKLKAELLKWQSEVMKQEIQLGIKQFPLPQESAVVATVLEGWTEKSSYMTASDVKEDPEQQPKEKEKKVAKPKAAQVSDEGDDVHIGRFDLRIGRITSAQKHPEADSLYLEQIELGEEKPRTVVSGLVKFVPLEEMQNRLVMVLCNLKPVKMRGIVSEAMVMCASTPDKVEILNPPSDAIPGDRVVCGDYPSKPDAVLNPKKKVLEQVLADLKTNADCIAVYKYSALKVGNKGVIKSVTLAGVQIK